MARDFPIGLVYGYHGTTDAAASSILEHGFAASLSKGEWLGRGSYFFEDEGRAELWGITRARREGRSPVVIRAALDLTDCLDLTKMRYRSLLVQHAALLEDLLPPQAIDSMRQTWGVREIDALVINQVCASLRKADGSPRFTTVRGCFAEGGPAFHLGPRSSNLGNLDHIQIAVTDNKAIDHVDLTYL